MFKKVGTLKPEIMCVLVNTNVFLVIIKYLYMTILLSKVQIPIIRKVSKTDLSTYIKFRPLSNRIY